MYGDFGSEVSNLLLFDEDGLTKARLETKGGKTYIADKNQPELDYFYSFLNDLRSLKKQMGYCTTDLSCTAYTINKTISRTQIDCQWEGFEYLKFFFMDRILEKYSVMKKKLATQRSTPISVLDTVITTFISMLSKLLHGATK